ncbi:hypothetical protein O8C74_08605 [Aliarcobacter butzleri]|uniref:hypothetical protein n=1 Tax=Aliarcobacter butzleri TaxID=28197 RepID=UPI0021B1CC37|nr:hypothetical protein [Aliarcobacter butzleri]MCG3717720.1 hypothetical protein [Aliarcobacter butzleri]MCT7581230.1 hypothetical protein [Aliarcobacter butzleri]MDN5072326.1 hypothetical protein [Aliarcobacter butzleri]MDN5087130.1 hypothetical protein [Aliarcobacter butzleri]MDN5121562.1 hypothetical protein [Aliarcobacter butzleri]
MYNFTYFYDKLLNFYGVKNLKGLSEVTGIPISTISSIKQRESITALKKKCRELDIYNEIFGDNFNTFTQTGTGSTQIKTQNNTGESVYNSSSRIEKNTNIDNELLPLFEALSSVANALNKKEHLKKELTNLISKLPTL